MKLRTSIVLLAACVIIARGADDLVSMRPAGVWAGVAALAVAIVPVAAPVASTLLLCAGGYAAFSIATLVSAALVAAGGLVAART